MAHKGTVKRRRLNFGFGVLGRSEPRHASTLRYKKSGGGVGIVDKIFRPKRKKRK